MYKAPLKSSYCKQDYENKIVGRKKNNLDFEYICVIVNIITLIYEHSHLNAEKTC